MVKFTLTYFSVAKITWSSCGSLRNKPTIFLLDKLLTRDVILEMEKRKHRALSCLNRKLEPSPGFPGAILVLYRQLMFFVALTILEPVLSPCTGFAWYCSASEIYAISVVWKREPYLLPLIKKDFFLLFQRLSIVSRHILRAKLTFSLSENPNLVQFSEICIRALSAFLYRIFDNRSPVLAPEGAAFPNRWYESVHVR